MRKQLNSTALAVCVAGFLGGCTSSGIDGLEVTNVDRNAKTASVRPLVPAAKVPTGAQETRSAAATDFEASSELGFSAESAERPVELAVMRTESPRSDAVIGSNRNKPTIYRASFSDAKPIDFGKASPRHFDVHGVDVSRWQGKIDWDKLRRNGANFAFIKATDGGDHLDPNFHENWNAAKRAGVPRGAYHFFYWCRTASSQADWFIRNVPKEKGALPPVIDVEWNNESKTCRKRPSPEHVREKMQVFMDRLEAHYGQRPIIYTAPDFYEDNLEHAFRNHPFWLRSVAAHPSKVYPGREFVFWQYSGTGLAGSHSTQIDLNVFNGSASRWHKWLARNEH